MPATPPDIARFTTDGVVLTTDAVAGAAVLAAHPNARSGEEIEMFFVYPEHAQTMLNERFALQSAGGALHDGVELEEEGRDSLSQIPIVPVVPSITLVDHDARVIQVRLSGYARSMRIDRFAIEVEE